MNVFFEKIKNPFFILIILIFFQFVVISIQIPLGDRQSVFEKAVTTTISPIKNGISSLTRGVGDFFDNYLFYRSSQKEIDSLKNELLLYHQENLFLKNSLKKIDSEISIKNRLSDFYKNIKITNVIGFDLNNYYKTIIIDSGSMEGIKKNMVVLDQYGNLVGRILHVISAKEARVQLITDKDVDIGAGVYTENGSPFGILAGDGTGMCQLKYILESDIQIKTGQNVFTSGTDSVFPRNIPVGKVFEIISTVSLFKEVKIKPFFKFKDLNQLVVLSGNLKEDY